VKNFIVLPLVLAMVFAPVMSHGETKGIYTETVILSPTAKVVSSIQIYGEPWYGGATQGFQALVQMVASERLTKEKIKLAWYEQTGKCPNDDQITQVRKGWDEMMIWLKDKGALEEVVTIFSSFGYPLDAPGPKILAAIVKMVSDVGVAAIGGYFLKAAFAALRPDQTTISGVSGVEGSGNSDNTNINKNRNKLISKPVQVTKTNVDVDTTSIANSKSKSGSKAKVVEK
jgi:hypothetical protein